MLAEAVQNAVDAVEDAYLLNLPGPLRIEVLIDLQANTIGVLDTGIGMTPAMVTSVFAPNVSYKNYPEIESKRTKSSAHRGYKGVGLTFLAYGTDEVAIHSCRDGSALKARMQYGRAWASGERSEAARMVEDDHPSPIDGGHRGTYIQLHFTHVTRPKSLGSLGTDLNMWETILRTKTAIGQILLHRDPITNFTVKLTLIDKDGVRKSKSISPGFLYPHIIKREPPFRFLDLTEHYVSNAETTEIAVDKRRQDGLHLVWDTERIQAELSQEHRREFTAELEAYSPCLYAFIPYQGSVWGDLNLLSTGVKNRRFLYPGLVLAVNRQRLADVFEVDATRFETFSRNVLVVVHFDNARPDQGRKTLQDEVLNLARRAADRVVQYLARQRAFLKGPGEAPTPEQRQIESDHDDWLYNVRKHEEKSPLHLPPLTLVSTPLTEQDVVGLFHQLAALGWFPGLQVFATSQSRTYDSLVRFDAPRDAPGLCYKNDLENPLGVSPYQLSTAQRFSTKPLTLEFKNNVDGLIDDVGGESAKRYTHIDICVCWSKISTSLQGYELEPIGVGNLDERKFPGVTHLLRKDGETHVISVIMLESLVDLLQRGAVKSQTPKNP